MKKNKSNAIKIGPWNIPKRLVDFIDRYSKKHDINKTTVVIEALEDLEEREGER